jgi:hypothetical protein
VAERARTGFVPLDGLLAVAALTADAGEDAGGLLRRLAKGGVAAGPGVAVYAAC